MPLTSQQEKIATRQELLEQVFCELKNGLGADFEHLAINRVVLYNVVVSYFDDVDRHKDFHGTVLVDEAKQAAYTIKWIAKLRPIQFDCDVEATSQSVLYVKRDFRNPVWPRFHEDLSR